MRELLKMHPLLLGLLFSLAYHIVVVPISMMEMTAMAANGVRNPIFTFSTLAMFPGLILGQLMVAVGMQPFFDALRSMAGTPELARVVGAAVPNFLFLWAAAALVLWLIRRFDTGARPSAT